MNILLLGKTGQTGFELHRTLSPLGTITAPGREELNLLDEQVVATHWPRKRERAARQRSRAACPK